MDRYQLAAPDGLLQRQPLGDVVEQFQDRLDVQPFQGRNPVEIVGIAALVISESVYLSGGNLVGRNRAVLNIQARGQSASSMGVASDNDAAISALFGFWLSLAINEKKPRLWEEADVSAERLRGEC